MSLQPITNSVLWKFIESNEQMLGFLLALAGTIVAILMFLARLIYKKYKEKEEQNKCNIKLSFNILEDKTIDLFNNINNKDEQKRIQKILKNDNTDSIDTFFYFCNNPIDSCACILFPFKLEHVGDSPSAKNVRVAIDFPRKNQVEFDIPQTVQLDKEHIVIIEKMENTANNYKETIAMYDYVQENYNFSLVRKGEKYISGVFLKIQKQDKIKDNPYIKDAARIKNIIEYFSINFSVFAEDSKPIHKKIHIYCFRGVSDEIASQATKDYFELKNETLLTRMRDRIFTYTPLVLKTVDEILVKHKHKIAMPPLLCSLRWPEDEIIFRHVCDLKKEVGTNNRNNFKNGTYWEIVPSISDLKLQPIFLGTNPPQSGKNKLLIYIIDIICIILLLIIIRVYYLHFK